MKVSEFLKDSHDPRGNLGVSVDFDVATQIAGEMRQIMNRDLEEIDIGLEAHLYNAKQDQEELIAAWEHLNAGERRIWREFVRIGKAHADQ